MMVSAAATAAAFSPVPYVGVLASLVDVLPIVPRKGKVQITMEVKVIDVTDGKTLLVTSGTGESVRDAKNVWGPLKNSANSTFSDTAAGEATSAALQPVCADILGARGIIDAVAAYKSRSASPN
jgi:hypothetical protein